MDRGITLLAIIAFALAFGLFISGTASADVVFQVGADKYNYLPTENITISGTAWSGTSNVSNTTISVRIYNSTSMQDFQVNTSPDGSFAFSYNTSNLTLGKHNITVNYSGTSSGAINFTTTRVAGAVGIIASDVYVVSFTDDTAKLNPPKPGWNTTRLYINDTNLSQSQFPYYIVTENVTTNTNVSRCEKIFVGTSTNFTLSNETVKAKYLKEGNFFKVNGTDYFVTYISPSCDRANIIRPSNFTFSGGETVKIVATPIDSNRIRVPAETIAGGALFEVYTQNGTRINATSITSEMWGYQIPSASGRYLMFLAGYPIGSFSVERFTLKAEVLNDADPPSSVYVIKPGASIKIVVDVINLSSGKAISSGATVTAEYTNASAASGKTTHSLSYDSSLDRWASPLHAGPASGSRTYKISATLSGETQSTSADVVAKSFEISTIPLSKGKGEGEGFAPDTPAIMVVSVTNMSDGALLNLTSFTNNCNRTYFGLNVTDSSGNNVLNAFNFSVFVSDTNANNSRYYTYNLTYFFTNLITDAPSGVVDEFKRNFGERSCVIVFKTPNQEGSFNTRLNVNISGTAETAYNSFLIQTLFVRGEPATDYRSGIWYFTPGSKITMLIKAKTADGVDIPRTNISEASLVEVAAEDGAIVTDSMLNETFVNVNISGQDYAAISFIVNDSVMGFHRVAFRIKARVGSSDKEAEGDGWFVEKKYHIFAYPQTNRGEWFLGANDNITLVVQVYDEQGIQSMGASKGGGNSTSSASDTLQSISVSVDEIRFADGWTKATNWQASSGTTDGQGRATINITQTSPWSGGGYVVRVKATKSGTTDYGQGWFEVRNFNFWAWAQDWRVGVNQLINITLQSYSGNWSPINANVSLTGITYHGTSGSWVNVPVTNISASWANTNTTNGQGILQIPAGVILKSGFYEATLNATYQGLSQTSRAFFEAISFLIVTQKDKTEWDAFYQPGELVNITVKAGKKRTWMWPPDVEQPVNISRAWIDDFRQEGMFDPMMKKGDTGRETSLGLNTSTNCNGANYTCQVWFNTSGLGGGRYYFQVIANDTGGNQAQEFEFMQVKTFEIKSPELKYMQIPTTADYKYTNASAIKTDKDWKTCTDSSLTKPSWITNCKAYVNYTMTDRSISEGEPGIRVLIDFNSTNSTHSATNTRIYIDYNVSGWNFTNPEAFNSTRNPLTNKTADDTFTVGNITYKIVSIGDTVVLQSTNAVMRDSGGNGKADYINTDWNSNADTLAVYFVNNSANEYYAAFRSQDNWNGMRDDSWLGIDLDGDNNFEDAWHLVLNVSNNVVQNVYVSSSANLTNSSGVNTHRYPGTAPANFTTTGTPIYFVGAGYAERTGSSGYEIRFTSNRTGWSGMDLGTFGSGVNVSIPVMIVGGSRLAGATVSIAKVVSLGTGPPVEQNPYHSPSATTDANGVAVIQFNTSWLGSANGRYALKFSATAGGKSGESTGMPWEWPAMEKRDFKLRITPGTFGRIPVQELSASAGNLFNYTLYETSGERAADMGSRCADPAVVRAQPPFDWLVMNLTNTTTSVFVDDSMSCNWPTIFTTKPNYTVGQTIPFNRSGYRDFMNLSQIAIPENCFTATGASCANKFNLTFNMSRSQNVSTAMGLRFNLLNYSAGPPETVSVECTYLEWNWKPARMDNLQNGGFACDNKVRVNFTGGGGVNLSWQVVTVHLTNPWNLSLGGEWKVVKIANIINAAGEGTGYELVYYDDAAVTNADNWAGRNLNNLNGNQPRTDGWTFADRAMLINASTGAPVRTAYLGENITELGKSVFGGFIWESRIFLTNETNAPYPLPWTCDGYNNRFYFGRFSEADVNVDLNADWFDPFNAPQPNASEYYNIMLSDNECDGIGAISGGMYDDDRELMQRSACSGTGGSSPDSCGWGQEVPIDFYGTGGKAGLAPNEIQNTTTSMGMGRTMDERWFRLGEDSWPVTFVNKTVAGNGNLSILRETENFNRSEDITYYIKARKLDGTPVNGNASVASVFDFMNFAPVAAPSDSASIVNGVGTLRLASFTNRTGSYMISVRVCEGALCETMERSVFVGSMQQVYKMGEPGTGGGGGGGY